ncbi:MAG TPA: sulfotransferase domain-containing protein [Gammaproteobacteria bacterium]
MPGSFDTLKKPLHITYDALRFAALRANYYAGNYKNVVWLIGDGRSGTTYVSGLINAQAQYREMFEPFHPIYVKQMQNLAFHQYISPADVDHPFSAIAKDVFTGKLTSPFVDSRKIRLVYQGLLIKDIFANLFASWAYRKFQDLDIKIILLIRNPFAVALSKYKKKHWYWLTDPKEFLKQPELMRDYLQPFEDLIKNIGDDYVERQLLIWSIVNYVPLKQFSADQRHVVFYEDIVTQPQQELTKLFNFINPDSAQAALDSALPKLHIPSWVSGRDSTIVKGKSPIHSWQQELSPKLIQAGQTILKCFGLDQLYGKDGLPVNNVLTTLVTKKER